ARRPSGELLVRLGGRVPGDVDGHRSHSVAAPQDRRDIVWIVDILEHHDQIGLTSLEHLMDPLDAAASAWIPRVFGGSLLRKLTSVGDKWVGHRSGCVAFDRPHDAKLIPAIECWRATPTRPNS